MRGVIDEIDLDIAPGVCRLVAGGYAS